jgi:hypothetical protein
MLEAREARQLLQLHRKDLSPAPPRSLCPFDLVDRGWIADHSWPMAKRSGRRSRCDVRARLVLGALALVAGIFGALPSLALADRFVTADYTGTWDEAFVYQPSNPSDWQQSMHFVWDERVTARVGASTMIVTVRSRRLSIGGTFDSTFAPPNQARNCRGTFSVRSGAIKRGFFPLSLAMAGSRLNIVARAPLNGQFAQSSGTGDCAVAPNQSIGTAGSTPTSNSARAAVRVVLLGLRRRSYTKTLDTFDANPDGTKQVSVHGTFRAATSGKRQPRLPPLPPLVTPARVQAKRNALKALRASVEQALYPCSAGLAGGALLGAGPAAAPAGLVLLATGKPLCDALFKTIIDEDQTVKDPPRNDYFEVARVAAVQSRAASCSRFSGSTGTFCRELAAAGANVVSAFDRTRAIAAAIKTTVSRDTAAARARNQAAVNLQEQTLAKLGPQLSDALKAESTAAGAFQSLLRSRGLSVRVSVAQFKRDSKRLLRRVARHGVSAKTLKRLARPALRPRRFDPIAAL